MIDSKVKKEFLVRLVDTGKVEIVSEDGMKVMEKQFLSLPRQVTPHTPFSPRLKLVFRL